MPALTLSAGVIASIPLEPTVGSEILRGGQAKTLVFTLISGDAVWGWNSDVTASGAATAGIPMAVGAPVTDTADDFRIERRPVYLLSAAGGVVNYQIRYQ